MAKNYKSIYESGNDSIALEQRWYLKAETARGTLVAPAGTDFLYTQQGGSVTYAQAKTSSPHRSGRHNTDIIREKTSTEWTLPMLLNVKTDAMQGAGELDIAVATLWESLLGKKTVASGVHFDPSETPDVTFSLFHCGDHFSEQMPGAFVTGGELSLPGDGMASMTFNGAAKTRLLVGIGKITTDCNGGNVATVQAGEGWRFPVGGMVMLIKGDGTTRSTDTADGTPRRITAVDTTTGDVTVDGAQLADADGSTTPLYLAYYEPATPTGINDPQTGLVGDVSIDNLPSLSCVRSVTLSLENNHELVNYCFGESGLSGPLFVPGSRLDAMVSLEMNLNAGVVEYLNKLNDFIANAINLVVGNSAGRHFKVVLPKVKFNVPAISVPENGSIPITFEEGMCLQSVLDAGDEVQVKYL